METKPQTPKTYTYRYTNHDIIFSTDACGCSNLHVQDKRGKLAWKGNNCDRYCPCEKEGCHTLNPVSSVQIVPVTERENAPALYGVVN